MLCSVSTLRLLSVLHHTTHLVLVVLQTNLGRHPRARMLCTSIALVMWSDSGSLFLSSELAASQHRFSETVSTVLVKTSRAVCAPDIDCSPSRPIWISLVRLSLDLPIVFESLFCPLSSHPFLSDSSAPSAFREEPSASASRCLRHVSYSCTVSSFVRVFTSSNRFTSILMTDSSFFRSVFLHQSSFHWIFRWWDKCDRSLW